MTLRAILLGLVGASIICAYGYFNDFILFQTPFIGNNMPLSVYGGLVLIVLIINPLLFLIKKRLALSGKELSVILVLTLAACCIPTSGLMRTFTNTLIVPYQRAAMNPAWQEEGLIEMLPKQMLADVSKNNDESLTGFIQGLGVGSKHIPFSRIPWYAWTRTLSFWIPLILLLWAALIGLSVVVHRQWADHEQLPYPVATFANSLFPQENKPMSSLFKNPLFWISAIIVVFIHFNNYAYEWFPEIIAKIPTDIDFSPLRSYFPIFEKGDRYGILHPNFYFTAIALSYFLTLDVSFSLGIGPFLYAILNGILITYGITMGGNYMALKITDFLNFGAYLGLFFVILYTGRHYYFTVFRCAFFLSTSDKVETESIWGTRVFLICSIIFIVIITFIGLDWQLAVLLTMGIILLFLVMGRIIAETGLFYINPCWHASVILWGIFGAKVLGPKVITIMLMLSIVLTLDPRVALMPFMVNSLKIVDLQKVNIRKTAIFCVVAVIVGLAVAIPVTLYIQYDHGTDKSVWNYEMVPNFVFDETLRVKQQLTAQNTLEHSESLSGWKRFTEISPNKSHIIALFATLGIVILFSIFRLRFTKWPLHPILFLVWNSYPANLFCASFLVGWFIKAMVVKYGGGSVYQKLKPLMFGMIAGEMLGGLIPIIIGFVYYLVTGEFPKIFGIMPR